MATNPTILLIIRTLSSQGEKILGTRWLPFVDFLRGQLAGVGREAKGSSDKLLLYGFADISTAVTCLLDVLERSKDEHSWQASSGSVPLQIILDLAASSLRYQEMEGWAELEHEAVYISAGLRDQWQSLSAKAAALPDHELTPFNNEFSQLIFVEHDLGKREKLLAYRSLPILGDGTECFFCAMTDHHPSACPCRSLTMASWALADIGYLDFAEINDLYKEVFPLDPALVAELAQGVKTADLRRNHKLLTVVTYFDLFAVFQPRFLWNFVFTSHSRWDAIYAGGKLVFDNRNLHMGLDCLRVGQYEQAETLLHNESKRKDGNYFAANIALAFWSLEQNRHSDMGRYLEEARNLAHRSNELVYVNILLSRFYEEQKDYWNAKEAVNNALKADYDCLDVQYRRLQLAVREGLNERESRYLRSLVAGQQDFFIKVLLDPLLLPIQGMVEDVLLKQYKMLNVEAKENLQAAQGEFKALEIWMDKNDRQIKENKASLEKLAGQLQHQGYYDILDVSERSKGIFTICNRLRRAKVEQIQATLESQAQRLKSYQIFWKSYQYKSMFKDFQTTVYGASKKNKDALACITSGQPSDIRQGTKLIKELNRQMTTAQHLYGRLILVHTLLRGATIFAKKLLISEGVLLLLVALFFPLMGLAAGNDTSMAWAAELAKNGILLRKSLLVTGLFVAPTIALCWAMAEMQKK